VGTYRPILFSAVAVIAVLLAVICLARGWHRRFALGFALLSVGGVGALARELSVIPGSYVFGARLVYLACAIGGFLLIERTWAQMRK
jgi:hypothetical protein